MKSIVTTQTAISRRSFLRAAAAIAGAPLLLPSSVLGKNSPGNRVTLGIIGCGNQCTYDLPEFLNYDQAQVVAVCDVNRGSHGYRSPEQFLGREPIRDKVNEFYTKKTGASFKGCDMYSDFREVLARKDIDAVVIIAPDHWHAVMTIMAAEAGKDIYCEKPLSLTVRDGQEMIKAVRKHNRILQTGSQWRSKKHIREAAELVRNGRIGKIKRVQTFVAPNNFNGPGPGWKPMPVPEGFDYDFWLGPAPKAPYHADRCFYKFRFILDYSGGQTTNFGCHSNDVAQWAMGTDLTGPVEFEDCGGEFPAKGDLFTTPTKVAFKVRYANGVELECKTDKRSFGILFEGTEGTLEINSKTFVCKPESLKDAKPGVDFKPLYVSENHYRNFVDCVKSRRDPIEPVETGHRTATLCHLGNISMLLKRKLRWDPEREVVIGDSEATAMLSRPMRGPWHY